MINIIQKRVTFIFSITLMFLFLTGCQDSVKKTKQVPGKTGTPATKSVKKEPDKVESPSPTVTKTDVAPTGKQPSAHALNQRDECMKRLKGISLVINSNSWYNGDKFTKSLSDISPGYLREIPVCPVSGKPYQYQVSSDQKHYTLYCGGNHHSSAGLQANQPAVTELYVDKTMSIRAPDYHARRPRYNRDNKNLRKILGTLLGLKEKVYNGNPLTAKQKAKLEECLKEGEKIKLMAGRKRICREDAEKLPKIFELADLVREADEQVRKTGEPYRPPPRPRSKRGKTLPNPYKIGHSWAQHEYLKCAYQMEWIARGLDVFYHRNKKKYPDSLGKLEPDYVKALPCCPVSGQNDWAYKVSKDGRSYTLFCKGKNHVKEGFPQDHPVYTNAKYEKDCEEVQKRFRRVCIIRLKSNAPDKYNALVRDLSYSFLNVIDTASIGRRLTGREKYILSVFDKTMKKAIKEIEANPAAGQKGFLESIAESRERIRERANNYDQLKGFEIKFSRN